MLQQLKSSGSKEHSMPSERSFHLLQEVKLDRFYQVLRYIGTTLLSMAYLVVTVICVIEEHPMSSYLILPLFMVFLIAVIAILPQIKNIKKK
ncbi:MAG: hypothetical protein ACI9WL_000418 [Rubritalea sp.]|jgi:hypothetical protein